MSQRLPNPLTGQSPFVKWGNQLRDFVQRRSLILGADYLLEEGSKGTILHIKQSTGSAAPASSVSTQYIFVQSYGNYVIGQSTDGKSLVRIAKPYEHRNSITQTLIEGTLWTYTYSPAGAPPFLSRIASTNGYQEYQRIRPPWINASAASGGNPAQAATIFWADQPVGGTGIFSVSDLISSTAGAAVTWLDQNRGARAWTRKADQTTP